MAVLSIEADSIPVTVGSSDNGVSKAFADAELPSAVSSEKSLLLYNWKLMFEYFVPADNPSTNSPLISPLTYDLLDFHSTSLFVLSDVALIPIQKGSIFCGSVQSASKLKVTVVVETEESLIVTDLIPLTVSSFVVTSPNSLVIGLSKDVPSLFTTSIFISLYVFPGF